MTQTIERLKFILWCLRFYWRIYSRTRSRECARAELKQWDFRATDGYDWREADPVYAADEALSYYGD